MEKKTNVIDSEQRKVSKKEKFPKLVTAFFFESNVLIMG